MRRPDDIRDAAAEAQENRRKLLQWIVENFHSPLTQAWKRVEV